MTTQDSFMGAAQQFYQRIKTSAGENESTQPLQGLTELRKEIQQNGINALKIFNSYLDSLMQLHESCSEVVHWEAVARYPRPVLPKRPSAKEKVARKNLLCYRPSLVDKMLRQQKRKIQELEERVNEARMTDDRIFNVMLKNFLSNADYWQEIKFITETIYAGNALAYEKAIRIFDPFSALKRAGIPVCCHFGGGCQVVELHIDFEQVIPDFVPVYTQQGKLALEKMVPTAFHVLSQNHVLSCCLRVGREVFSLLPLTTLTVNVYSGKADAQREGRSADAILSVEFNAEGLRMLHYEALDCTAALLNFPHQVDFSVERGFSVIVLPAPQNFVTGGRGLPS